MDKRTKPARETPRPIVTDRVELAQESPGGDVKLTHRNKAGNVTTITISAARLEGWAIRQLRADTFA